MCLCGMCVLLVVDNADSLVHFTSLVYSQLKYFNMFSAVLFSGHNFLFLLFIAEAKSIRKSLLCYFVLKSIVVPDVIKIIFHNISIYPNTHTHTNTQTL